MTFLIVKILAYLVTAGVIGFAAGWLFRNLQGQKIEEQAQRSVHDAKSKVPQLESLLRGRDDQIKKLKEEAKDYRASLKVKDQAVADKERELMEQKRETNKYKQSQEAKKAFSLDGDDEDDTSDLIAELSREITSLKAELKVAEATDATIASSSEPQLDSAVFETEITALRDETIRLKDALQEASANLEREQSAVAELERERELQNKSLKVLHQQLELERSRKAANG